MSGASDPLTSFRLDSINESHMSTHASSQRPTPLNAGVHFSNRITTIKKLVIGLRPPEHV